MSKFHYLDLVKEMYFIIQLQKDVHRLPLILDALVVLWLEWLP